MFFASFLAFLSFCGKFLYQIRLYSVSLHFPHQKNLSIDSGLLFLIFVYYLQNITFSLPRFVGNNFECTLLFFLSFFHNTCFFSCLFFFCSHKITVVGLGRFSFFTIMMSIRCKLYAVIVSSYPSVELPPRTKIIRFLPDTPVPDNGKVERALNLIP